MQSPAAQAQDFVREGRARFEAGRFEEAEAAFRAALGLFPGHPAVLHALAMTHRERGEFSAAEALLRAALPNADRLDALIRACLGQVLLAQGRYLEGFPLLDSWRMIPDKREQAAPQLPLPRWTGESLTGRRLLVWSEEGLGDQIMYARFAKLLADAGEDVLWAAPAELLRLFAETLGVTTAGQGESMTAALWIPSSSLPAVMMAERPAPPSAPYLTSPPAVSRGGRIGLVTRGNPAHWNDRHRSLPEADATRLRQMLGPFALDLTPANTGARDFHDTAAIIAGLDLVITVDTSVAHLAGAMGKPVWVLLPAFGADWRWQVCADTSPWYPSARLIRQRAIGDWREAVETAAAEATHWLRDGDDRGWL